MGKQKKEALAAESISSSDKDNGNITEGDDDNDWGDVDTLTKLPAVPSITPLKRQASAPLEIKQRNLKNIPIKRVPSSEYTQRRVVKQTQKHEINYTPVDN